MYQIHLFSGYTALLSGLLVLLGTKGNQWHRYLGYTYVASMVVLNGTSFTLYELFGGFGIFHIMAMLSLANVVAGLVPLALRHRWRGWFGFHNRMMAYSYVGLLMATGSHLMEGVIGLIQGWVASKTTAQVIAMILLWVIPYLVGMFFIERYNLRIRQGTERANESA